MQHEENEKKGAVSLTLLSNFEATTEKALLDSLSRLAQTHKLAYLLSYHNDGLIWGMFNGNGWVLSAGKFRVSPEFRILTLQECRAFGLQAEILIWRDGDKLKASLLTEGSGEEMPYFDRTYLLWGDNVVQHKEGFTLLREGAQGLHHAVPLANATPRVQLKVRNYIGYDDCHQAYVKWSRLVKIFGSD